MNILINSAFVVLFTALAFAADTEPTHAATHPTAAPTSPVTHQSEPSTHPATHSEASTHPSTTHQSEPPTTPPHTNHETAPTTIYTGPTTVPPVRPANTTICKGHKEGEYIIDPKDPHVYYECNGRGLAYKFTCPHSLIFNQEKHICDFDPHASTVRPTRDPKTPGSNFDCTNKPDGMYPDPKDKTVFHQCHAGFGSDFKCPPTTVFDPERKICVNPTF
ncbi:hypothetical protein TYRP_019138 [Tyrophagus putrescentiae]|nr:hypothetical protein TYRP_019138 [Tyrophagus putrescentiae]WCD24782.1 Tyr p 37 allergen [Tyrophagus putrescentiae]